MHSVNLNRRTLLKSSAALIALASLPTVRLSHGAASPAPTKGSQVLKGAHIITMAGDQAPLIGDLWVVDGTIRSIGTDLIAPDADPIDCTGKVIIPGFVDTHHHMWQGLFRNQAPDELLNDYFTRFLVPTSPKITAEDVYLGNKLSALSALNAGITQSLDWSHITNSPAHADAAIAALRDSRARAVYAFSTSMNFQGPGDNPYPMDIFRIRREHFSHSDDRLTLALGAMGPEFAGRTPDEAIQNAIAEWNLARHPEIQARISVHVGVGAGGARMPVKRLADALAAQNLPGLGADTTYIHCVRLSDAELKQIIDSGGSMSLAVPIAMQMGMGLPPVERIRRIDPAYRYSLSIDVQTNQAGDMFSKMRALFQLQRALRTEADPEACQFTFFQDPRACRDGLITARETLAAATIEGARANGLAETTGSLEVGKQADLVVLDGQSINVAPLNDPIGQVVQAMDTSNVESVMVGGEWVKWDRQLLGVDVPKLLREAADARARILGA